MRTDLLVHWTGHDIETDRSLLSPVLRAAYVARLSSTFGATQKRVRLPHLPGKSPQMSRCVTVLRAAADISWAAPFNVPGPRETTTKRDLPASGTCPPAPGRRG